MIGHTVGYDIEQAAQRLDVTPDSYLTPYAMAEESRRSIDTHLARRLGARHIFLRELTPRQALSLDDIAYVLEQDALDDLLTPESVVGSRLLNENSDSIFENYWYFEQTPLPGGQVGYKMRYKHGKLFEGFRD